MNDSRFKTFQDPLKMDPSLQNRTLTPGILRRRSDLDCQPLLSQRVTYVSDAKNTSSNTKLDVKEKNDLRSPINTVRRREVAVPSTRVSRVANFGQLGVRLAAGTATDLLKSALFEKDGSKKTVREALMTPENAQILVDSLCKMRGAALKLGQMFSLQDDTFISPELQQIFERVRSAADFMPFRQVESVLRKELGADWRSKFLDFDAQPFAAASLGQVHKATVQTKAGEQRVVVKVQYPGVQRSINSDIQNLVTLLKFWQLVPRGLFIEKFMVVAQRELAEECDYQREARYQKHFASLLSSHPTPLVAAPAVNVQVHVPKVFDNLSTQRVLTMQFAEGIALDKCVSLDHPTRNAIGDCVLRLTVRELFEFGTMQTDPNWSNFLYDNASRRVTLLDFGASREYSRQFVRSYVQVIKAAANGDRQAALETSVQARLLSGLESERMKDAHLEALLTLAEAFASEEFDFAQQSIVKRIQRIIPVMLQHRLVPPPEETYSLHRKLSGVFLLCAKLGAKVRCKEIFDNAYAYFQRQDTQSASS